MIAPVRNATRVLSAAAALAVALVACDSDPNGPAAPGTDAVLVGSVESQESSAGAVAHAASASATHARTVVAGQIQANGSFQAVSGAEAEVDVQGRYRIENVPTGRTNLVVVARADGGAEVGRALVHAETRSGSETRVAPIEARSTLHARTYAQVRASGESEDRAAPAELALFLHARSEVAAAAAASDAEVGQLANATLDARSALEATLAREGVSMDVTARQSALAALAVSFEEALHAGTEARTAHRAFVAASTDALEAEGAGAAALTLAFAAAGARMDRLTAQADHRARLDVVRNLILLNLRARARLLQETEADGLGLRSVVIQTVQNLEASVEASASVAELRTALAAERAQLESRIETAVLGALGSLPIELHAEIAAHLSTVIARVEASAELEAAASAEAAAEAVSRYRAELESAVAAWLDSLPQEARASLSLEAALAIFLAMGAGCPVA